uniref:Uncharacterized protein n=1 Tax=Arundo donax TaxID=35708 RepID=A0A0A9E8F7_ARUDO
MALHTLLDLLGNIETITLEETWHYYSSCNETQIGTRSTKWSTLKSIARNLIQR